MRKSTPDHVGQFRKHTFRQEAAVDRLSREDEQPVPDVLAAPAFQ